MDFFSCDISLQQLPPRKQILISPQLTNPKAHLLDRLRSVAHGLSVKKRCLVTGKTIVRTLDLFVQMVGTKISSLKQILIYI